MILMYVGNKAERQNIIIQKESFLDVTTMGWKEIDNILLRK
jgi:hypothetical protein